jgi:3-hydroxyacyl-[acyl-carrier-protein] dehydratase
LINTIALAIAADHPAYAGHFPGAPVLPGVVLLDAALRAVGGTAGSPGAPGVGAGEIASASGLRRWEIASAKFLSAVRPGEALTLQHETLPNGSIRFSIETADRTVASGTLVPSADATGPDRGKQS